LKHANVLNADAADPDGIRGHLGGNTTIDIGFADAPYELRSRWQNEQTNAVPPEMKVLAALAELSVPVVILATRKGLKLENSKYRRDAKLQNGHRSLRIFKLACE
jgi:hypothetical protein